MDELCASELFKEFKLLYSRLCACWMKVRCALFRFDDCIQEEAEIERFIILYRIDSVLFKLYKHLRNLKRTIGFYVQEKGQVFFPGKVKIKYFTTKHFLRVHSSSKVLSQENFFYFIFFYFE